MEKGAYLMPGKELLHPKINQAQEVSRGKPALWSDCIKNSCLDYSNGNGPCDQRLIGEIVCPSLPPQERDLLNTHLAKLVVDRAAREAEVLKARQEAWRKFNTLPIHKRPTKLVGIHCSSCKTSYAATDLSPLVKEPKNNHPIIGPCSICNQWTTKVNSK